jgi:hypothetical protein
MKHPTSVNGLVVKFSVAIGEPRVRFPVHAGKLRFCHFNRPLYPVGRPLFAPFKLTCWRLRLPCRDHVRPSRELAKETLPFAGDDGSPWVAWLRVTFRFFATPVRRPSSCDEQAAVPSRAAEPVISLPAPVESSFGDTQLTLRVGSQSVYLPICLASRATHRQFHPPCPRPSSMSRTRQRTTSALS